MSGYPPNQYPPNQYPPNQSPESQHPQNQYPPNQAQPNQYPPQQQYPPPQQYPQGAYPPNQYPPNQYPPNPYQQQQNPYYQQQPYPQNQADISPYVPCPRCRMPAPQPVKFTWWGGMLGPKMLSHVKCQQCGLAYNGKSGQSNTKGIVLYAVIVNVIVFGIIILIAVARS